jgi:hypothetical protein
MRKILWSIKINPRAHHKAHRLKKMPKSSENCQNVANVTEHILYFKGFSFNFYKRKDLMFANDGG